MVVPAEYRVTFNEAPVLVRIEQDDCVNNVPPRTNDMEDQLSVDVSDEDDWNLRDILHYSAIDIRPSLRGDFSAIQKKVLYTARTRQLMLGASYGLHFKTLSWSITRRWND